MSKYKKFLVVGAGFFGAVVAERVAEDLGLPVTVIDRRPHIGGNCWSSVDGETGVEYHMYGSHIFHTSDEAVWKYISRFTKFNAYRHHVWTQYKGHVYAMPINLHTINSYYAKNFSPEEARAFIRREAEAEGIAAPANLEEKAVSLIGRPLYEAFFRGYTLKQWEKDPTDLDASIITRLPVRYNYNNRYFADTYEGIPLDGYGEIFRRMLDHPLISVRLETDFAHVRETLSEDTLVCYTGAIDQFFEYRLGRLEWRTVDFTEERPPCADFQGTSVMNYADAEVPWTRIHEFKHYHPERPCTGRTLIFKEFSRFAGLDDAPYYPVATPRNAALLKEYRRLASALPGVVFGGRLGAYRYLDMDDTIAEALVCYAATLRPRLTERGQA